MNDVKHFNYEGNVDLKSKPKEIEILDIEFLTPARLKLSVDGKETFVAVNVDIINRKVYQANGKQFLSERVFQYLDNVNTLPEDFFEAPPEVYEEVGKIDPEKYKNPQEVVGDING